MYKKRQVEAEAESIASERGSILDQKVYLTDEKTGKRVNVGETSKKQNPSK